MTAERPLAGRGQALFDSATKDRFGSVRDIRPTGLNVCILARSYQNRSGRFRPQNRQFEISSARTASGATEPTGGIGSAGLSWRAHRRDGGGFLPFVSVIGTSNERHFPDLRGRGQESHIPGRPAGKYKY